MRKIRLHKRDPVYKQIIHYFKVLIANGELQPGEKIPSRRELATFLDVNPNTVQRAYQEMEEEQLIHTERNFPSKITTDEQKVTYIRESLIHQAVETFVESIQMIQVPVDEVCNRIENRLKQESEGQRND